MNKNTQDTLEKVRVAIQEFRRINQRAYAWGLAKYYLRISNVMPSRHDQDISKPLAKKIQAKVATIVSIAIQ